MFTLQCRQRSALPDGGEALGVMTAPALAWSWQCNHGEGNKCRAELLCMAQVLGNNPNYVSYVPACGVPNSASALHHRYSTDFPVSEPPAQTIGQCTLKLFCSAWQASHVASVEHAM